MKNYSNTTFALIRRAKRLETSKRYQNEVRGRWRTKSFEMYGEGHPQEVQAWSNATTLLLQSYCGAKPKVVTLNPDDCHNVLCSTGCPDKSRKRKEQDYVIKHNKANDRQRELDAFISIAEGYLGCLVTIIIQVELAKKPFGEQDPTTLDLKLPKTYSQLGNWIRNTIPQGIQAGFCETTVMAFNHTAMKTSTALGISHKEAEGVVLDDFLQIIRIVTLNYSVVESLASYLVKDGFLLRKTIDSLVADVYDQLFETIDLED